MPKLHKRHFILAKAKNEMSALFENLVEKHNLSVSEALNVLSDALSKVTSNCVVSEREVSDK
jgi:hypothetical protein